MTFTQVKSLVILRNEPETLKSSKDCTFGHDISSLWNCLAKNHGFGYTGDECRVKYKNLRKRYWDEMDETRKSGVRARIGSIGI